MHGAHVGVWGRVAGRRHDQEHIRRTQDKEDHKKVRPGKQHASGDHQDHQITHVKEELDIVDSDPFLGKKLSQIIKTAAKVSVLSFAASSR